MLPAIFTERIINASNSSDNAIVRAREFEWVIISGQEPITRSVQLPYSVCETAFSQVEAFPAN